MTLRLFCLLSISASFSPCAVAQGAPTAAVAHDLLRATAAGAYSVRYLPDRALISSSAKDATELRVFLPSKPRWGYLDNVRLPDCGCLWDTAAGMLALKLAAGEHALQVGWEGNGEQPQQGGKIPVLLDGAPAGELTTHFTLDGMTAEGGLTTAPALARVWLVPRDPVRAFEGTLNIGDVKLDRWELVRGRLLGRGHVGLGGETSLSLQVPVYNLISSPVATIEIESISRPVAAPRVEKMPADGIVIEAEDFVGQGGGTVEISVGQHLDQHGGKSIFNFGGNGHWLEWQFEAPEAGQYDLFAKVACAEEMSFREVTVDRRLPAPGYGMVKFPGTGGWAHAPGEWWVVQVAGGAGELPPLELSAGKHTLRMKGVLGYHLNLDYMVVKKH